MDDSDQYGILIHAYEKNNRTSVRFHVQEYKGTEFLDVREFYFDAKEDAWKPSKKGLTVRPHLYAEFLHGLVQAAEPLGLDLPEGLGDEEGT